MPIGFNNTTTVNSKTFSLPDKRDFPSSEPDYSPPSIFNNLGGNTGPDQYVTPNPNQEDGLQDYNIDPKQDSNVDVTSHNNTIKIWSRGKDYPVKINDIGGNNEYDIIGRDQIVDFNNIGGPPLKDGSINNNNGANDQIDLNQENKGNKINLDGSDPVTVNLNNVSDVTIDNAGTGDVKLVGQASNTTIENQDAGILDITKLSGDAKTKVINDKSSGEIIEKKGQDKTLDIENPGHGQILFK